MNRTRRRAPNHATASSSAAPRMAGASTARFITPWCSTCTDNGLHRAPTSSRCNLGMPLEHPMLQTESSTRSSRPPIGSLPIGSCTQSPDPRRAEPPAPSLPLEYAPVHERLDVLGRARCRLLGMQREDASGVSRASFWVLPLQSVGRTRAFAADAPSSVCNIGYSSGITELAASNC